MGYKIEVYRGILECGVAEYEEEGDRCPKTWRSGDGAVSSRLNQQSPNETDNSSKAISASRKAASFVESGGRSGISGPIASDNVG